MDMFINRVLAHPLPRRLLHELSTLHDSSFILSDEDLAKLKPLFRAVWPSLFFLFITFSLALVSQKLIFTFFRMLFAIIRCEEVHHAVFFVVLVPLYIVVLKDLIIRYDLLISLGNRLFDWLFP